MCYIYVPKNIKQFKVYVLYILTAVMQHQGVDFGA